MLRTKSNFLVEKAARLLGIVDDYDVLRDNGIYYYYIYKEIYASYSTDSKKVEVVTGV